MVLARRFSYLADCPRRWPRGLAPRLWLAATGIAFACLAPISAAGQHELRPREAQQVAQRATYGPQGVLASVAYGKVAPGLTIDVRLFDDSELSQTLGQRFEAELSSAGHAVAPPAALSLAFQTEVIPGSFLEDERNLARLRAGTAGVNVLLNLWSSSEDSLLGGRRPDGRRDANVLHMNVVLRDLGSRKVLWQADAYGELVSGDHRRVGLAMIAPIVARIGQTVTEERFALE